MEREHDSSHDKVHSLGRAIFSALNDFRQGNMRNHLANFLINMKFTEQVHIKVLYRIRGGGLFSN